VTDGALEQFDIQEIVGGAGQSAGNVLSSIGITPVQVTIDGSCVYAIGPGGILCVNAITAKRAFRADWPTGLKPEMPTGSTTPVVTSGPYGPVPNPYAPAPSVYMPGHGPSSISNFQGISGLRAPTVSRVDRGVLYATVTPNHVVALTDRSADDQ